MGQFHNLHTRAWVNLFLEVRDRFGSVLAGRDGSRLWGGQGPKQGSKTPNLAAIRKVRFNKGKVGFKKTEGLEKLLL